LHAVKNVRGGDLRALSGHSVGMRRIGVRRLLRTPERRYLALEFALLLVSVVVAAVGSSAEQWRPTIPLAALLALVVVADVLRLKTRTARVSSSITVLVAIMALFGPAPAVLGGCLSTFVGSVIHGTPRRWAFSNVATYAVLGVVGGLWFSVLDDWVSQERSPLLFAMVTGASLLPLVALNFALVVVPLRQSSGAKVRLAFVASFVPFIPWQLTSALIAGGAVFAYEQVGLVAVAVLAVVLAVTAPLLRSVVVALQRADSMSELRAMSDQRAAEVERLPSDRARLLGEVLDVADHERRRLAETLHDGPLQRLLAVRQDLAERGEPAAADLARDASGDGGIPSVDVDRTRRRGHGASSSGAVPAATRRARGRGGGGVGAVGGSAAVLGRTRARHQRGQTRAAQPRPSRRRRRGGGPVPRGDRQRAWNRLLAGRCGRAGRACRPRRGPSASRGRRRNAGDRHGPDGRHVRAGYAASLREDGYGNGRPNLTCHEPQPRASNAGYAADSGQHGGLHRRAGVTAASSTSSQRHPVLDVAAFVALMVVTDLLPFKTHTVRVSGVSRSW
jgi:signal transduction histidine kinase